MRFFKLVISVCLVSMYMALLVMPASAFPHIQEIEISEANKTNNLINVKGGKFYKGAGVASKIPGLELLGTAKYIYGIMASVIGALMIGAFKFAGRWEDKKYLK